MASHRTASINIPVEKPSVVPPLHTRILHAPIELLKALFVLTTMSAYHSLAGLRQSQVHGNAPVVVTVNGEHTGHEAAASGASE